MQLARQPVLVLLGAVAFSMLASACSGEVGGEVPFEDAGTPVFDLGMVTDAGSLPDAGPPPDMGDPLQLTLPDPLSTLTVTATCVALDPGERALGVDPEGHLWLANTSTTQIGLRVLDAWGEAPARRWSTRYENIAALVAESATTASVLADGEVWSFQDGIRLRISAPFQPAPDATMCGSLAERAFVATGDELYERRGPEWVRWQGIDQALAGAPRVVARGGACFGASDDVLLASGDLETWTLGPRSITRTSSLTGATDPAVRHDQLLARDGDDLLTGPEPFVRHIAPSPVRALGTGGSYAWFVFGSTLVRYDGAVFEAADLQISRADITLHGFAAGGVWTTTERSACAVTPPTQLRVSGLKSGQRSTNAQFALRARPSDPTADVFARLEGRELAPQRVEDGWLVFAGPLELGWSTVRLSVSPGELQRSLTIKREPLETRSWQTDVRPIFEAHCAQAACHVADSTGGAPDLTLYEAWLLRADLIERRVVDRQDMPPAATRSPEWDMEEVRVIEQWLEGGLRP